MDNYERDQENNPAPKYDPAGETKQKIIFAIVVFVVLILFKVVGGF